jgi:hypothetical protein
MLDRLTRIALIAATLGMAAATASSAPAPPGEPQEETVMDLSYRHGRLSYRKKSTGVERGREDWWLTRNRDGSRTLRCLAMTDDSKFVRDAQATVDAEGRTEDAFVRLQVGDRWVGGGYLRLEGNQLRVTTDAASTGRTEQLLEVPSPFHVTTHAVMLDGWIAWGYDLAKGGEQTLTMYNASTRWDGTDGPLGRLETIRVEFLGEEEVTVPAGTFQTRHFRFDADGIDVPTSHLWVTGDDNLLIRYDWSGFDLEYVLVSLVNESGAGDE